jgi:LPS-assembly lipoprotein
MSSFDSLRHGRALPRRALLLTAAVAAISATGCGFRLREPVRFTFRRIAFNGFRAGSTMETELRRALQAGTGVQVVPTLQQAEVVLDVLDDLREKGVVAVTATGQVREFVLRTQLRFRVLRPDGSVLMEPTQIDQRRDLSFTETTALSKEREEAQLVRAMQADIADQVMRRLASIDRG